MGSVTPQTLPEAWESFVNSLSAIWNELGMEDGVRETHLNDVLQKVEEVLNERVRQERNVRDLTRRSIQTFASKIVLIYKQLGHDESGAHEFISEHTGPHVSLFHSRDALSRQLEELTAERKQLVNELVSVLTHLFAMEADLGESSGALELFSELQSDSFDETRGNTFRNDPSNIDEDTLRNIPHTLERLRAKMVDTKSLCESRQATLDNLNETIAALCHDVGENKDGFRNASLLQHPPLSTKKIEAVKQIENQLISLRERRGAILHDLANKLRVVWDQLEIPTEYRESFCSLNEGRSMEVIRACEEELRRVEILKQERIHELILLLRDRIRRAWDELSVPQIERKLFEDRYDYVAESTFSDEALAAHKVLANSLESMVKLAEPLIAKIKEHMTLLEEKVKYDELTKNGDRLRDRKYNMREEEKLRKRVARLPVVTDTLIIELAKWKTQNRNQPLIYNGVDYLQQLQNEKMRAEEERLARQEEKRRGGTLVSTTSSVFQKYGPSSSSSSSSTSSMSFAANASSTNNGGQPQPQPAMTPSRPRSISRPAVVAPATTGKPVSARPRTNTAESTKAISTTVHPTKENISNVKS